MFESVRTRHRTMLFVSAVCLLVLVGGGALGLATDHPLATLGVGGTPGTAFTTVDAQTDTYTERHVHRIERDAGTYSTNRTAVHDDDGTAIRSTTVDDAQWQPRNLTRRETVRHDGSAYRMEQYDAGTVPADADDPSVRVAGDTSYERIPVGHVNDFGLADRSLFDRLAYARAGTTTRSSETLVRYDVVGTRGEFLSRFRDSATGYLLVTPDSEVIRRARIRVPTDRGGAVVTYIGRPGANASIPSWVSTARDLPRPGTE